VIRKIPERVRESFKVVGGKDLKKESEEKWQTMQNLKRRLQK
jgi:hypothetical protein